PAKRGRGTVVVRVLSLLDALERAGDYLTSGELATALGVRDEGVVLRDLRAVRAAGVPLEVAGRNKHRRYGLAPGWRCERCPADRSCLQCGDPSGWLLCCS